MVKNRLEKWEDDVTSAANNAMKKRWDFLFILNWYSNLEEFESLISRENIFDAKDKTDALERIQKIKQNYPFEDRHFLPTWEIESFTVDVLILTGGLKKLLSISYSSFLTYNPRERTRQIIESFWDSVKHRKKNYEDEIERASQAKLLSTKLKTYWLRFFISIFAIIIGFAIGFLFFSIQKK